MLEAPVKLIRSLAEAGFNKMQEQDITAPEIDSHHPRVAAHSRHKGLLDNKDKGILRVTRPPITIEASNIGSDLFIYLGLVIVQNFPDSAIYLLSIFSLFTPVSLIVRCSIG